MRKINNFPSKPTSASVIIGVARRCTDGADVYELSTYICRSKETTINAVKMAKMLSMINENEGVITTVAECIKDCSASTRLDDSTILKKWSLKWQPFVAYLSFIQDGCNNNEASSRLCSYYDFGRPRDVVETIMESMVYNCKLKGSDDDHICKRPEVFEESLFDSEINSEVDIRLYLNHIFGDEAINNISEDVMSNLVVALSQYKTDPRNAIECSGRALEDHVREMCIAKKIDLSKKKGLIEVSESYFDHYKYKEIAKSVGHIKNMAGHGIESSSGIRWKLSPIGALSCILMTITIINASAKGCEKNEF